MFSRSKAGRLTRRSSWPRALWQRGHRCRMQPWQAGNWEFLSEEQARTLASICDQIVPADEFPSASRLSPHLHRFVSSSATTAAIRTRTGSGLEQSSKRAAAGDSATIWPHSRSANSLMLSATSHSRIGRFFELVRSHTLEGYYGSPAHGAIATPSVGECWA